VSQALLTFEASNALQWHQALLKVVGPFTCEMLHLLKKDIIHICELLKGISFKNT
jgi:hypothetical protein